MRSSIRRLARTDTREATDQSEAPAAPRKLIADRSER
jgi:hypothetical protein